MLTPQQDGGGLSEASRLLQEGLQLLDDRTREVDAAVRQSRGDRARQITEEARERALEITAEAERQRAELEEQVAALRNEVASRTQGAGRAQRASPRDSGAVRRRQRSYRAIPAPKAGPGRSFGAQDPSHDTDESPPLPRSPMHREAPNQGPRWGRQSSSAAAQQAIRERGSRPRWLPPWLPFVIVLLAAAGLVAANVDAVGGARSLVGDTFASPPATRDVIVVTFAPTQGRSRYQRVARADGRGGDVHRHVDCRRGRARCPSRRRPRRRPERRHSR